MIVGTDVCVPVVFVWGETQYPGKTHLSQLVTTWPSHMPSFRWTYLLTYEDPVSFPVHNSRFCHRQIFSPDS